MSRTVVLVCILLFLPLTARAAGSDDDRGATAGVTVSATNMQSRTELTFSGAFGYRLSRIVEFELEVTVVPKLHSGFTGGAIIQTASGTTDTLSSFYSGVPASSLFTIFPGPVLSNRSGRLVVFSNNVRIDIPTTSTRVTPYFVAGGGVAHVRKTADYSYTFPAITNPFVLPTVIPPQRTFTEHLVSTETDLALTLGGGVDVWINSHTAVTADLRLLRLLGGEDDQNAGRFGVGVRYRF